MIGMKLPDHIRTAAIGIQLDQKAQRLYPPDQIRQFPVKRRLSAADADAIQDALSLFQISQHFILRKKRLLLRMEYQVFILAERAAEVASAKKEGSPHLSGVIEECQCLKTVNLHFIILS